MFFPSRAFVDYRGRIYFFRARSGAVYEVTPEERQAILAQAYKLHWKMAAIIVLAFTSFGVVILLLPFILTLPFEFAMAVMLGLVILSLVPLGFMLKFHLDFQHQVRDVLGEKMAVDFDMTTIEPKSEDSPTPAKAPPPPKQVKQKKLMDQVKDRERHVRFFWVFFMGVVITSVGTTMLFGSDELSTRMFFIWVVWLMTGLGFLFVGLMGIIYRYQDSKSGERKYRD